MAGGVPQVSTCNVTVGSLLALSNNPTFTATAYQGDLQSPQPVDLRSAESDPATPAVP